MLDLLDLRASLPLTAHVFLHRGLVAGGLLVEPRLMKARHSSWEAIAIAALFR